MSITQVILEAVSDFVFEQYGEDAPLQALTLQKTRKEFSGDFTLVVFPFVKITKVSPEATAKLIGDALIERVDELQSYNVIKGFLNLSLHPNFWIDYLARNSGNARFGFRPKGEGAPVVVEYSSPNTNKPLHLGHVRNNLLGYSVAKILEASGRRVYKVNLVNDRGIHICKSMLAWIKYGKGRTPYTTGMKGDKLVGEYYVKFETELKIQVGELMLAGYTDEEIARKDAPLMKEAQELLRKWEDGDAQTLAIWCAMNGWVYEGFNQTYRKLGVEFDKTYYESETYLLGKELVMEGLKKGVFEKRSDNSVWVTLNNDPLDEKLLLRSDGTSVYITQDLGTAQLRFDDFYPGEMIYVVGNEQNYHFEVLQKVLQKLRKPYADAVYHLSYGMVELPEGKMKSREGTVVDADDLFEEMVDTARRTTEELGKVQDFSEEEKAQLYNILGMGALKYFILKVDPKKNMLFNPSESIDFNGNTGPFIQYTYARISSILRMAQSGKPLQAKVQLAPEKLNLLERNLLRTIFDFPGVVLDAANAHSPAQIANYAYDLCKEYNQFYHEHSVLNEPDPQISHFRVKLSEMVSTVVKNAMSLLGIDVPERM
ncbi:MAG TPA: arginine--tRNA ligase [Bacteroidales bacterium]|nr:arginine--tRNA ligase [Bacteroidales bacterium]